MTHYHEASKLVVLVLNVRGPVLPSHADFLSLVNRDSTDKAWLFKKKHEKILPEDWLLSCGRRPHTISEKR